MKAYERTPKHNELTKRLGTHIHTQDIIFKSKNSENREKTTLASTKPSPRHRITHTKPGTRKTGVQVLFLVLCEMNKKGLVMYTHLHRITHTHETTIDTESSTHTRAREARNQKKLVSKPCFLFYVCVTHTKAHPHTRSQHTLTHTHTHHKAKEKEHTHAYTLHTRTHAHDQLCVFYLISKLSYSQCWHKKARKPTSSRSSSACVRIECQIVSTTYGPDTYGLLHPAGTGGSLLRILL